MPDQETIPASEANSAAVTTPAGGAAAPETQGTPAPNSTAVTTPDGGAAGAADSGPLTTHEELLAEITHANRRLSQAVAGYSDMQRRNDELQKQLVEAQKQALTAGGIPFPKTVEEMAAVLKDPENRLRPLIESVARNAVANAGQPQGYPHMVAPQAQRQAFADNLAAITVTREVAKFAIDSGMNEYEVISFLSDQGLIVDPQTGNMTQAPFSWASSPDVAVRLGKDAIRGRMAEKNAKILAEKAIKAGQVAADAQVKGQLPASGAVSAGGGSGAQDDAEFAEFIASL